MRTDFFTPQFFSYTPPADNAGQAPRARINADQVEYSANLYGSVEAFERHPDFDDFVNQVEIATENIVIALYDVADGPAAETLAIENRFRSFASDVESKNFWLEEGGKAVMYQQGKRNYIRFSELCHEKDIPKALRFAQLQQLSLGLNEALCGTGANNNLLLAVNTLERALHGIHGLAKAKTDLIVLEEIDRSIGKYLPEFLNSGRHTHVYSAFNNKLRDDFGFHNLPFMPEVPQYDYSNQVKNEWVSDCAQRIEGRFGSQLAYEIGRDYRNAFIQALQRAGLLTTNDDAQALSDSWMELTLSKEQEQALHDVQDNFSKASAAQYGDVASSCLIRYREGISKDESRCYQINKQPTLVALHMLGELEKAGYVQTKPTEEIWEKAKAMGKYTVRAQIVSHHGILCYQNSLHTARRIEAAGSSLSASKSVAPEPEIERDLVRLEHLKKIAPEVLNRAAPRTAPSGLTADQVSALFSRRQADPTMARRLMKEALANSPLQDVIQLASDDAGQRWIKYIIVAEILPDICRLNDPGKVLTPLLHGGADIRARDDRGLNLMEWCVRHHDTKVSEWFFKEALFNPWRLYSENNYREMLQQARPEDRKRMLDVLLNDADRAWRPELTRLLNGETAGSKPVMSWILKHGTAEECEKIVLCLSSRMIDTEDRLALLKQGLRGALALPRQDNLKKFFREIQGSDRLTQNERIACWHALTEGRTYLADMMKSGRAEEVENYCRLVLEECDDVDIARELLQLDDEQGTIAIGDIRAAAGTVQDSASKYKVMVAANKYSSSIIASSLPPAVKLEFLSQKDREGLTLFIRLVTENNSVAAGEYLHGLMTGDERMPFGHVKTLICDARIAGFPVLDTILAYQAWKSGDNLIDRYLAEILNGARGGKLESGQIVKLLSGADGKNVPSLARALASTKEADATQIETAMPASTDEVKEDGIKHYVKSILLAPLGTFEKVKLLSGGDNDFGINVLAFGYLFGNKAKVDEIKALITAESGLQRYLDKIIPKESQLDEIRADASRMQVLRRYLSGADQESASSARARAQEQLTQALEQPVECAAEDLSGDIPISNIRYALGVAKQALMDDFFLKGGAMGSTLGEVFFAPKSKEILNDMGFKGFDCLHHKLQNSSYFFWFTPTLHKIGGQSPKGFAQSPPADTSHVFLQLGNRIVVLLKDQNKDWHVYTEGRETEKLADLNAFLGRAEGSRCISLQYSPEAKQSATLYGEDEAEEAASEEDEDFFDGGSDTAEIEID